VAPIHETHGLPPGAAYLTGYCAGQKVKLANLAKGALVAEAGGTFVGVEAAGQAPPWPPSSEGGGGVGSLFFTLVNLRLSVLQTAFPVFVTRLRCCVHCDRDAAQKSGFRFGPTKA